MTPHETLSTLPNQAFHELCEQVIADMDRLSIPGVAVGVLAGDQELAAGFGVTSVENPLPVTPDTLFQIGSITKTFVATAVMRLVENGKLDLDSPVRLAFYAEDRVVGLDEPCKDARGEFLRDPDGRIAWLRVSGRLHRRVDAP